MNNLLSSFIIDPVVRQARRISSSAGASSPHIAEGSDAQSHANANAHAGRRPTPHPPSDVSAAPSALSDEDAQAGEGRSLALIDRFRQYSPFIRRPQSVVVDDDEDEDAERAEELDGGPRDRTIWHARPTPPSEPLYIPAADVDVAMSSNPDRSLEAQFHQLDVDAALLPTTLASATTTTAGRQSLNRTSSSPGPTRQHAPAMSESLPADDGMHHLRLRIHQIRELGVAEEDKARMMHGIMTERYNILRPQSPSSFVSHDRPFTPTSGQSIFSEPHVSSPFSAASEIDPENPFNLRPGDTNPTHRLRSSNPSTDNHGEDEDFDTAEDGSSLGCQHYKRNVKVQCYECRRWYTCRHCHDAVEDHNLNRKKTQNMLCMVCGTPQSAGEYCVQCGTQAAWYYCDICKLWDDNSSKKIYHCIDCGICRKGQGLGKDYIHCKRCNVCISIAHAETHKCLERATDCNCPICGDYLFNSSSAVVSMPCGHYLHKGCYKAYMETAYKCPMCKKSAVNMELQWRKLTHAIESQPMPEQFSDTRAVIQCNDCSAKSSVKYHWLGNKCNTCDSYNTNELRILNGPESEEAANQLLSADTESGGRSPVSASSPSSQPLRSPRYYFQPDQPEETWLPGQLPSFPFQMPQFPGMPQIPQMLQMPQFRGMPQLPLLPQMPQMLDRSELMERFSRTFSPFRNYLNPTGEIAAEDVPIIDLGEDRPRELRATDGSTVQQPSLPQYVLERFSRSLEPLRNYLNPSIDNIPQLDLSEEQDSDGLQFWGEDGSRVDRFLSGGEEEDEGEADEDSSSDESMEDVDEDDEDGEAEGDDNDFALPGHR